MNMFSEDDAIKRGDGFSPSSEDFSVEFEVDSIEDADQEELVLSSNVIQENEDILKKGLSFDSVYADIVKRQTIKIIGVGGGGGNVAQRIYQDNIEGVSYLVVNTDAQQLNSNKIPNKIMLGETVTKGLGAGADPERARLAADESEEKIRKALDDGHTEMVIITAGMGGGTGTGATPVVARIAKDLGLLTVAFVSIPFLYEGTQHIIKALEAVKKLKGVVDSLLVINNERLFRHYHKTDTSFQEALSIADAEVSKAASSISRIIMRDGYMNADFNDVKKILKGGGVAVISSAVAKGEKRITKALEEALSSPVLNSNDISKAKRLLIAVEYPPDNPTDKTHNFKTSELEDLTAFTSSINSEYDLISGYYPNSDLTEEIRVIVLASGFDLPSTIDSIGKDDGIEISKYIQDKIEESELIQEYYSDIAITDPYRRIQGHRTLPFILNLDELDDDEFISIVYSTPAYKRNHEELDSLRKLRHPELQVHEKKSLWTKNRPIIQSEGPAVLGNCFDFNED